MRIKLLLWLVIPVVLLLLVTNYITNSRAEEITLNKTFPEYTDVANKRDMLEKIRENLTKSFNWRGGGAVTFWFDDAWMSQYTQGFSLMAKHGFKGALAVPTDLVKYEGYMEWWQIQRLQYNGWEIDSHSVSHECETQNLVGGKLEEELRYSKTEIMSRGVLADIYVAPCGEVNPELIELAKTYYKALRVSEPGLNDIPVLDRYFIKANVMLNTTTIEEVDSLVAEAKLTRKWLVLMFHQIDNSQDTYAVTPQMLEDIIESVKTAKIQVVLPLQMLSLK